MDSGNILITLITAQAILIATLTIWKQYWVSVYNMYILDNEINNQNNWTWFVAFMSSILSWAVLSGIFGLIIYIIIIVMHLFKLTWLFGIGIGFSIFMISVLIFAVLLTSISMWKKGSMGTKYWRPLRIDEIKSKKLRRILFGTLTHPQENAEVEAVFNRLSFNFRLGFVVSMVIGILYTIFYF